MKKILKIIKNILLTIFAIIGILILLFIYITKYRITDVCEFTNPNEKYTVSFQAVGEPEWPFGRTKVRVTLLDKNNHRIESFTTHVHNDGATARKGNIKVEWFENYAQITLMGGEQDDDVHKMYYNGFTWIIDNLHKVVYNDRVKN